MYKLAKLFKEGLNSIQDKNKQETMANSPETVGSVILLLLPDRRVTVEEDISEQLRIAVDSVQKIVYDDLVRYSKC